MKRYLKSFAYLFSIAGLIIVLDQWTKSLILNNMEIGEVWKAMPWLTPYARIVHWHNTGVAFGMFPEFGDVLKILPGIIALAIIIVFPQVPEKEWYLRLAMAFQVGGAIGNLIDRYTVGYVVDFISVGTFPVFNVADSCITVGVGILLLGMWLQERKEKREKQENGDPETQNKPTDILPTDEMAQ